MQAPVGDAARENAAKHDHAAIFITQSSPSYRLLAGDKTQSVAFAPVVSVRHDLLCATRPRTDDAPVPPASEPVRDWQFAANRGDCGRRVGMQSYRRSMH
ncbi:hypothetical protein METSCH_B06260 [Metschnikowia aff. pulcherrima]|uniref:Uncharacterized protein n=1 Tax=Metschnikowia aff. pulcherrima TaxID=2163413 RepID=A0A4P6XP18_9ASCO|nr:hypothetical protein METSCH_B06260 [Metschnikowia aff. pulcherrima]